MIGQLLGGGIALIILFLGAFALGAFVALYCLPELLRGIMEGDPKDKPSRIELRCRKLLLWVHRKAWGTYKEKP